MTQETPTAAPAPLRTADDTPMMQQYLSLKRKHADAILFFRMGDFYEMFFEDAKEAAGILEIALTARNKNKGAPIPMCGVPHHSSRQYIAKLVKAGKTVAICEQMEDPRFAKGLVKRDVVRTITPGTVLDDALLDPKTHHFLAAVVQGRDSVGLAAVDLSTGLFQVCELPLDRGGTFLEDQLAKWDPQEILVPKAAESSPRSGSYFFQPRDDWTFGHQQARRTLLDHFRTQSLDGFGCEPLKNAVAAAGGLLHYLQETQKSALGHITRLSTLHAADTMFLDQATIASLELVRASDGQRAQSLLGHLDQSRTPMGARRIRDWILNALVAKTPAEARLHVVAELVDEPLLRREVRDELKGIMDLERLLARISLRLGSPRDVSALKQSLSRLPGLRERLESLESAACQPFLDRWDAMADLHAAIDAILVDDPPLAAKEGHLIKSGCDAELDRLKTVARNSGQAIAALEAKERERTLIPQLKVGYNKIYGYYLEATKKNLDRIPPDYIRKQSLVNAERFISPELKKLEEEITGAEEKIQQKEQALFQKLCAQVAGQGARLQSMARVIGEVDALAAFAEVAHRRQYTRPELTDDDTLLIKNGRHPLLEDMHGGVGFVPNDTRLDGGDHQVLIITGPNMAGKSTYLRQ
ncbi:MAG: DNA mismatch repair protein MutS, partial [Nitrospinaceae bacterium]